MSAWYMHTDPNVYQDAMTFRPERWLENVTPEMHRNYVPFSKGSRRCLGSEYVLIPATIYALCLT